MVKKLNLTDEIDIIILNCNDGENIRRLINSIREYTEGPYNLIVIDQNSQDGSRQWLIDSKFGHIVLNNRNMGVAGGRNIGIRVGKCPWFLLIDSDIEIHDKFWLDKLWNYTIDRKIGYVEGKVWNHLDKKWECAGMSFCLIRRQCFNEIGYFDRRFYIGGDDDWLARFENNRWWKTGWCSDTLVSHHNHKTMLSIFGKERFAYLQKESDIMLAEKYTEEFILRTVIKHIEDRCDREEDND